MFFHKIKCSLSFIGLNKSLIIIFPAIHPKKTSHASLEDFTFSWSNVLLFEKTFYLAGCIVQGGCVTPVKTSFSAREAFQLHGCSSLLKEKEHSVNVFLNLSLWMSILIHLCGTILLICSANELAGFCMAGTLVLNHYRFICKAN